jgi:biotin synthase
MMDSKHYRDSRANSILTGDKLLTAANAGDDKDAALMARLGLGPMKAEEPLSAFKALGSAE